MRHFCHLFLVHLNCKGPSSGLGCSASMSHEVSFSHLQWGLPAALSPHSAHARSSVPGFLLSTCSPGLKVIWLRSCTAPSQGCSGIPAMSDFPTPSGHLLAPLRFLLGPWQKSQGLWEVFFITFFLASVTFSSAM